MTSEIIGILINRIPGLHLAMLSLPDLPGIFDALHYLLDNTFIRFGSKLYRQIVGISMGTNCAPLVADLFLFYFERDFMLSLYEAFNSTSRYLDDLLNIDYPYIAQMVSQICHTDLQLHVNKANPSDTETAFLDLDLSITNGIVIITRLSIPQTMVGQASDLMPP